MKAFMKRVTSQTSLFKSPLQKNIKKPDQPYRLLKAHILHSSITLLYLSRLITPNPRHLHLIIIPTIRLRPRITDPGNIEIADWWSLDSRMVMHMGAESAVWPALSFLTSSAVEKGSSGPNRNPQEVEDQIIL